MTHDNGDISEDSPGNAHREYVRSARIKATCASAANRAQATALDSWSSSIVELTPMIRRVVAQRLRDRDAAEDIVQETLARLLAARERLDEETAGPYAIVTARNLVSTRWRRADVGKRHEHRLV